MLALVFIFDLLYYTASSLNAKQLTRVDNLNTPGSPNVILNYRYDPVYNLTSITDTFNNQVQGSESLSYDALDRLQILTQTGANLIDKKVTMSYDAANQLRTIVRYSDLQRFVASSAYNFDRSGRINAQVHSDSNGSVAIYNYRYDPGDRLINYEGILRNLPTETSSYDYDFTDQLTGAVHTNQANETYSYDKNGNRTNPGYATGLDNRLSTDGVNNYTYDGEGNLITATAIATGVLTTYTWDYRNRLTGVVITDSLGTVNRTVEYVYDSLDRRIAKIVDPDGVGIQPTSSERFIYQGDNVHLVFEGTGGLKERFLFGPGVDQVLAMETNGTVIWGQGRSPGYDSQHC